MRCEKRLKVLVGRLQSCDIPNLDKFTLTLFMAIADRERELIGIRTKAALTEKRKRDGEWRKGSMAFREKLAVNKAVSAIQDNAAKNENNRRARALLSSGRETTSLPDITSVNSPITGLSL